MTHAVRGCRVVVVALRFHGSIRVYEVGRATASEKTEIDRVVKFAQHMVASLNDGPDGPRPERSITCNFLKIDP